MTEKQTITVEEKNSTDQGLITYRQRLTLFSTALFVSLVLCLFGPFEIFHSNRGEFEVSFGDILLPIMAFSLFFAAIGTVAGLLLPRKMRSGLIAVLLALGVLFWVQGSFIPWDYGEFDGTAIDWAAFVWQGWVDVSIWLLVLIVALRFRDRLYRHALFFAWAFIVIQAGVVVTKTTLLPNDPAVSNAAQNTKDDLQPVNQEICQLSSTSNIFQIIMDSFQTDIFMDLVGEEDLDELLDGFTVYTENISSGSRTILSVPAMFSSEIYEGNESESEYFNRTMSRSFQHVLHENGYVINLMPHVATMNIPFTNFFTIRSRYSETRSARWLRISSYLIDISMFRQSPHFLKRLIYNDQNWLLNSLVSDPPNHRSFHQKAFFRDYISKLEVGFSKPAYHFLHMMPPHPPLVTLPDGSYAGAALPHTRENYTIEARFMIRLFLEFLEKLKNLDVYDSSIILLQGDHGAGWQRGNNDSHLGKRAGRISALLLFKPDGSTGPLDYSVSQTSLTDIPTTLLDLVGIEHQYPGESFLDLSPSVTRDREVVFVTDRSTGEPTIHRWIVRGSVFDSTSWHQIKLGKLEKQVYPYSWGTSVRFGIAHGGDRYLTSGWSTTASKYAWNNGKSAEIVLGIEEPPTDVLIQFSFYPYIIPGKVDRQRIKISVNGNPQGEIECVNQSGRMISGVVPRELLGGKRMVISFQFPDAISPRDIGMSSDPREFAIKLVRFKAALHSPGRPPDR